MVVQIDHIKKYVNWKGFIIWLSEGFYEILANL